MGSFNDYVWPKKPITPEASQLTGIEVQGETMLLNGQAVQPVPIREALERFCLFLGDQKVVLTAHNARTFDSRVMYNAADACGMLDSLQKGVVCFLDTLPLFRTILPGRKSYKQEVLVADLLSKSYAAHDALADVKVLQELMVYVDPSIDKISPHTFDIDFVKNSLQHLSMKTSNVTTLTPFKGLISKGMVEKMAASGLQFKHIKLAYDRKQHQGVHDILAEKLPSGKTRVTNYEKIISNVVSFFDGQKLSEQKC